MSTLYALPNSSASAKVRIAAALAGVPLTIAPFVAGETTETAEFKALNPSGRLPMLVTEDGTLTGSNAILRHLARMRPEASLYGADFYASAHVDAWLDFEALSVEVPAAQWVYPILGLLPYDGRLEGAAKGKLLAAAATLDAHLLLKTYFVGERLTLADVAIFSALLLPMRLVLDEAARGPLVNLTRWFTTVAAQPAVADIVGDVVLCSVPLSGKPFDKKAYKKAKKAREKAAKKAAKAKAAGGGSGDSGDAAAAAPAPAPKPAKKPKHPCATLPKSSMSLDAWKKTYSNSHDLRGDAMPKFWEMLDTEGYSLWLCNYNYNAENTKLFMTCNLVGGFIQRCDAFRKYAFGVMDILGSEGDSLEVCGAWLLRGQDHSFVLADNPDAEYYTWTKVDLADEAAKEKVAAFWCEEEEIDGKPIADSKVFK